MKIGIYGGTFNPPHLGHFTAARTAAVALGLDKLLIIPAALPPHKPLPENTPTPEHRLAMAEKLADSLLLPQIAEVSSLELEREGKSYTSDTLETLAARYPGAELWLLMGTDMFLTLHLWHEPERILSLASICAFGRTEQDGEAVFAPQRNLLLQKFPNARITTITLPGLVDVSSTQLREWLRTDDPKAGALLPQQVYGYILRHGLYGTKADMKHLTDEQLRAVSYSMMYAKRMAHVQGTEEEAVKLAERWGANKESARRAAILHDCTKYYTVDEHMALCRQYDIPLDPIEKGSEKLFHAKTGAALACHVFGEPKEVQAAIYYHTTGKGNMTTLEKILYLADYMEPHRDFPGVEKLRALAYVDLDAAVALGCEMSIDEMQEKGRPVHPNTQAALDSLRK